MKTNFYKTFRKLNLRFNIRFGYLWILVILFSASCSKDENTPKPGSGKIEIGPFTEVLTENVGVQGKVLTVQGGDVNGLAIEIPQGSYKSGKDFVISTAKINSHTFGPDFNPLTPMIRINNGGDYADSIITITIPCTVPKDHFAMGFYYNEETGELEGIPVLAITDGFVVLATRHFSGKHLNEGTGGLIAREKIWADIIVSSMEIKKLFDETQESGFRPGIDDWEYPNQGSYIEPEGHCAGQSLTAMWYYHVRKLGLKENPLNDRFSTLPNPIWQENVQGYRFSSVIQKAMNWDNADSTFNVFHATNKGKIAKDSLHFLGFAYSIRLTKKPQFVFIGSPTGAHAMIIYRTNLNVLSVADPNFPGQSSRFISLSNGAFLPYESKANTLAASQFYPEIKYLASSAIISSEGIAAHYEDMLAGKIGSQEPYFFPPSELVYHNGKEWVKLPDTLMTQSDTISIAAKCLQCGYRYPGGDFTGMKWIKTNGDSSVLNDLNGHLKIALTTGENVLPLQIYGAKNGAKFGYLDFKMPVMIKEPLAGFGYWLKELLDDNTLGAGFGYKTMQGQFAGKWLGTTYKVDYQKDFDIDGRHGTVFAKYTANCNSNKTLINSFNIELWTLEGTTKGVVISLDGKNLPLTSSDGSNLVFSAYGAAACSTLTRVDYFVAGQPAKYSCDETSFVFFTIPKP